MLLADQGAEVIKIERPATGDPRRGYDPLIEGEGGRLNRGFLSYNRNKRSVTVDLTTSQGREDYLRSADGADVIVENLRPGAVERLGIGYDIVSIRTRRINQHGETAVEFRRTFMAYKRASPQARRVFPEPQHDWTV